MSRALEMALVGAGSSRRGGRRNPIDAPVIIGGAILAGLLVWALWPKSSATSKGSGTGGSTNPPLVTPPSNLGGTPTNPLSVITDQQRGGQVSGVVGIPIPITLNPAADGGPWVVTSSDPNVVNFGVTASGSGISSATLNGGIGAALPHNSGTAMLTFTATGGGNTDSFTVSVTVV